MNLQLTSEIKLDDKSLGIAVIPSLVMARFEIGWEKSQPIKTMRLVDIGDDPEFGEMMTLLSITAFALESNGVVGKRFKRPRPRWTSSDVPISDSWSEPDAVTLESSNESDQPSADVIVVDAV